MVMTASNPSGSSSFISRWTLDPERNVVLVNRCSTERVVAQALDFWIDGTIHVLKVNRQGAAWTLVKMCLWMKIYIFALNRDKLSCVSSEFLARLKGSVYSL